MGIFDDVTDFVEDTTIMGSLFGGGGSSGGMSETNKMIQEQIEQSQKQLRQEKRHLYSTQMETIHGQGAVNWSPTASTGDMFGG